jgi:hypothetical protein
MDVSITKLHLDTSILEKSIMGRREYDMLAAPKQKRKKQRDG